MVPSLLTIAAIGFVFAILATLCWVWYMGITIDVDVREIPEMTILNMNYTGAMQYCTKGCMDMERRVKDILPNMPKLSQAGSAYYTAPSQVKNQNDNRWSCFYILDENKELLEIAKALPVSDDYMVKTIPGMKAIYATFPYRSNLSYMLGPMKVYPAITAFMNAHNLKPVGCFEIYHFDNQPIEYIMYLENEDIFKQLEETKSVAAYLL